MDASKQRRKDNGLCYRCGKRPPVLNRQKCKPCLDIAKDFTKQRRAMREKQDLCVTCGERRDVKAYMCLRCIRRRYLHRAKYRAKKAGVPFRLSYEDLVFPEQCPCCSTYLTHETRVRGQPASNTYSLDRIIPQLGYSAENVVMVCQRCNGIKKDATIDELYRIADFFYRERKRRLTETAEGGRPRGDD